MNDLEIKFRKLKIQEKIKNLGIKQHVIAKHLGVTHNYISLVLNDKRTASRFLDRLEKYVEDKEALDKILAKTI